MKFVSIEIPALIKQFDLIPVFFVESFLDLVLKPYRHKTTPFTSEVHGNERNTYTKDLSKYMTQEFVMFIMMVMKMDNNQLQKLVEEISITTFGRPFLHKAIFNTRLRTTGGRYLLKTGNIEINKKYFDAYGIEELIGIIKHELCHYHLHQMKRGYQHKDRDFKELAKRVGAPRYCRALPQAENRITKQYAYQCVKCHQLFIRKRAVNTKKYVCGKCGGRLQEVNRMITG